MIFGHGDDRHHYQQAIQTDFSSNVWFGGTSPELISHLRQNLHLIGNYPEPDATCFCQKIADSHKVNTNQVLAFNGSTEGFYTIALAFRKSVSAILVPAFAEYEDACQMHDHQIQFFRKDEWRTVLKSGPGLFWIGNPNNPDGTIFCTSQIEKALVAYPETVFVVDEAYAAFITEFESSIPLTKVYPNLIVVRSLTKCCAIPGLRLGYVVASEKQANRLRKFQQPWSVNALAQEAGKFLIGHMEKYPLNTRIISKLSFDLQQSIDQLETLRVIPSYAPFFLVEMQSGTADALKQFLLDKHGILIRDASNFRGLNPNYFRICSRDESDNRFLLEALKNYSKTNMS
ncbi:MAG: histidinol-phosphate aminotransferase family protein [Lentimicrobiaceae bacterium]|nr:histidinol-phosphate aminotransferase family protein [Lentimicrobiaceae bacterium]